MLLRNTDKVTVCVVVCVVCSLSLPATAHNTHNIDFQSSLSVVNVTTVYDCMCYYNIMFLTCHHEGKV